METNKIFSKLNMKNYNNELEKILEDKSFSLDVKNLLLSMLYKIESGYKDYLTVKIEVLPENDFIEMLLKIIKDKCFEIELINPETEIETIIDKTKGKIICYPNEKSLLSSIWYLGEGEINIKVPPYECVKSAVYEMLYIGSNINQVEVIRDFNGWSWDSVIKEIEDIKYNLIYQSILLLKGKKIIYKNILLEENSNGYINTKNEELKRFFYIVYYLTTNIYIRKNNEKYEEIMRIKESKNDFFRLLNNKKEFIQEMTIQKKVCTAKIEEIDKILNNTELLKQEYKRRNEKLPNKEKIFSISHLVDKLEKEREEYLKKIKECNKVLEPQEFVKEKQNIKKEVEFLSKIDLEKENSQIIELCKEFLRCVEKKIEKMEEKLEIIEWIYKIRYYGYIPFNKNTYLKDIKELKQDFEKVIKLLIKKAQTFKIWDIFSPDVEITYRVIEELFYSKMINLENVNMICKYEKNTLYVEYYDTNILEKNAKFEVNKIRIKKKFKLFL